MVYFHYDSKRKVYSCRGKQYATGGDSKTNPFTRWYFGDVDSRKPMVYHQSIAWGVNYGMDSWLDSNIAYSVFRQMPEEVKKAGGLELLKSGLKINPYSFLLTNALMKNLSSVSDIPPFWKEFKATLASAAKKPGCPRGGLYYKSVKNTMMSKVGKLTPPKDEAAAAEILKFLEQEQCVFAETTYAYRIIVKGLARVLASTNREYKKHMLTVKAKASKQNDTDNKKMAAKIKALGSCIKDKEKKRNWARAGFSMSKKHAKFFGNGYRISTNSSLPLFAKMAGQKMPSDSDLIKPILNQVLTDFKKSVLNPRNLKACGVLARKIDACDAAIKDPRLKGLWFNKMAKVIQGRENFLPKGAKKSTDTKRDPCADSIDKALEAIKQTG
jgi:hypothetical protein